MMKKILALDIDDCIFPSDQTYFGTTEDSLILLEVNLKRIILMLNKYNMKVFITSSWFSILRLEDGILYYTREIMEDKEYYKQEYSAFLLLKQYLETYIIGLSCGGRRTDIKTLLEKGNKVIAFDDIDLSDIEHKNYLYVYVHGFVSNEITYKIKNWMKQ